MEKSGSLTSKATEFIRDLILKIKFPADGKLIWNSAQEKGREDVEVNFSVELSPEYKGDRILRFKAQCHFCTSGLCLVQIFGQKNGEAYDVIALFRDTGEHRQFEIHEPGGHTRQGYYPIGVVSSS